MKSPTRVLELKSCSPITCKNTWRKFHEQHPIIVLHLCIDACCVAVQMFCFQIELLSNCVSFTSEESAAMIPWVLLLHTGLVKAFRGSICKQKEINFLQRTSLKKTNPISLLSPILCWGWFSCTSRSLLKCCYICSIFMSSFFLRAIVLFAVSIWLLLLKGKNDHHNHYLVWQKMKEGLL